MDAFTLNIPPGVYNHGTDSESDGRWRDANLVRWTNNAIQPIGGWEQVSGAQITGARVCRGAHSWYTNAGIPYIGTGTFDKLYVLDGSSTLTDITPATFTSGNLVADENLGYGGKTYGSGSYGVSRISDGQTQGATTWSVDNWGENLVACSTADGRILEWQLDAGLNAEPIVASTGSVPVSNQSIIVTAERFLFALGADGNPRKIKWCDREDNTDWAPVATNEAGDIEIQSPGNILTGLRVRGRTLILTTVDAHIATYQGPPTVYGFQRVATGCGLACPLGAASIGAVAFWIGENNFFVYNGSTVEAIPCEVHDHVFKNINRQEINNAFCVANQKFNEVWWFYPSSGSIENDRYVAFDYRENHWIIGSIGRSAGVDSGVFSNQMLIDSSGYFYRHEKGYTHGGVKPYAETGPLRIAEGNKVMRVNSVIPEETTQGQVDLTFKTRFYPNSAESTHGPYSTDNPTDVRFTGRQVRVRIDAEDGVNWRFGKIRMRANEGGYR